MASSLPIGVFAQNDSQAAYLAYLVRLAGHMPEMGAEKAGSAPILLVVGNILKRAEEGQDVLLIKTPQKAADIIERLRNIAEAREAPPVEISIGGAILDTVENIWQREDTVAVRLTEKEAEILICLYSAGGKTVSRDDLLRMVWAYAPEAETHTLETHIYRLRQKIESDPAAPTVLLTDEEGYKLAF